MLVEEMTWFPDAYRSQPGVVRLDQDAVYWLENEPCEHYRPRALKDLQ